MKLIKFNKGVCLSAYITLVPASMIASCVSNIRRIVVAGGGGLGEAIMRVVQCVESATAFTSFP